MGAILLVGVWVLIGLGTTIALLYILNVEDREQKRERIAREQGHYPPVRTLKPRRDAPLYMQEDTRP